MKRFWKQATLLPLDNGWAVGLDQRPVKTPKGQTLSVPGQALAAAIAAEWDAQGEVVQPQQLPLTRIAATALDRMGEEREAIIGELARFAETDLVCYRALEPAELVAAQQAAWDPWLAWAAERHGLSLTLTDGLMPVEQSPEALSTAATVLAALDPFKLAVAACLVPPLGSLILALPVLGGHLSAQEAFILSQTDEQHQIDRWGLDAEAAERRALLAADIADAGRFLQLLQGDGP